jgi:2,5-diketo-D-gluconate reductase B
VFEKPTIRTITKRHDTSATAVASAWATGYDNVVTIPKASSRAHLQANLAAVDLDLTDEDVARIEGIEREEELFPE